MTPWDGRYRPCSTSDKLLEVLPSNCLLDRETYGITVRVLHLCTHDIREGLHENSPPKHA